MAAPVDNTATLKSLVSVANSKIEPKILTDRNFEVLSIKPLRSTTSPHNTVALVQVDLAGDSPIAIVSSDRYSRRLVEFTRIDLKDIADFRAIPKNEKGQYIGEIPDATSVITLLNAAIGENELVLIKTADATVVKAAEDSLGYVGAITFAGANAEEPTPEDAPPVELNTILIDGPTTVAVNGTVQFTILTSPDDAPAPETLVWSSLHGVSISENGLYVAGADPVVDTITATVTLAGGGTLTADHTLTVTPAEAK